ncbi:hypothetical protein PsorP6_012024 [Peronosclerospora sorghi]|uniref:Uncharacterized protein n=1 Tax=Peronosclerospora sorghi TaxID=230839 RepID=A0ACC0WLC3_9STRA|nr:hypothetical protein PsorP6_012024 [Peronosclerospora sorghi]
MPTSLPLPPRFFKCPALTDREVQYLVGKAKESAKALVDATRNNEGPVRWEEAGMHRGVQMYKGEARYPETLKGEAIPYGCGATTIQSTLEEVADYFDLSTDDKVAQFVEASDDVMDCQLLYVIQDPALLNEPRATTTRTPPRSGGCKMLHANQVTVKWFAMDVPSKLMKNRDFLTVECQSTFLDGSGRRGWVRAYHSIKLPCCPPLSDYHLVRGSFYHTGYVFVESDKRGYLDVIFSAQMSMKGNVKVPAALYMTLQKRRLSGVAELQKLITRRRLGAHRFLGDLELVPKSHRTRCHLCSTKFGLITRKARCRRCGEVVCSSACSTEWEVSIPGQGVRKVRVCLKCAQNTDPSVFEDLPASEKGSSTSTHSAHEDDVRFVSARTGNQYYGQSERDVSPRHRTRDSGEEDGYDEFRPPRRRYSNSYEERYSHGDSDEEFPRTVEMPGTEFAALRYDSGRYRSDSGEYDDDPPSRGRRRDESTRFDPDEYDHHPSYSLSPPHDRADRRAQPRSQRLENKHRMLQRQHEPQDSHVRRRHKETEPSRVMLDTSMVSSNMSGESYHSSDSAGAPSFLTSSLLAHHTKKMGKPGPVAPTDRGGAPLGVRDEPHTKRRKPRAVRDPPPALSTDRPLTRLEQLQVQQWMEQEAKFREQAMAAPALDLALEPSDVTPRPSYHRRSSSFESSSTHRGPVLPAFFRSLHNQAPFPGPEGPSGESVPPFMSKTHVTHSGQRTVSVADDEDGLETSVSGLAHSFSSFLRPEDLRETEESMCLSVDSTSLDFCTMADSDTVDATAKASVERSKSAIVKLYQQVLELTNKQHELEAQPESDPDERTQVAQELEALYAQIHAHVESN